MKKLTSPKKIVSEFRFYSGLLIWTLKFTTHPLWP